MAQDLTTSIKKALELIRSGKMDAARPILLEVLKEDETIEQAWFLLSYTLPTTEKQEYALNQALRINPTFDKALERLDQIRGVEVAERIEPKVTESNVTEPKVTEAGEADLRSQETLSESEISDSEANVDEQVLERDNEGLNSFPKDTFLDMGDSDDEEEENTGSSRRLIAIIGLTFLFLVVLLLVLSPGILTNLFSSNGGALEPTQVQGFRTLPPTWTP